MARFFGFRSAEQRAASARGEWWNRMSRIVQLHTGRPMKDNAGRFDGSDVATLRAAICDGMVDSYAGDFRHVGLVRGLARQVAVRDVDDMIEHSDVPRPYRAILDERGAGEPAPADVNDRLRQAAADGFVEALDDHLRTQGIVREPDIARAMLEVSHGPGPQNSPLRSAATALFSASREAQAMIPPEQHQNAITSIQQAMENHARMIDTAAQDLHGHSGLPPRAMEQTLLETRMLGSEIAGTGIEAVDRLAHPPAPTGERLQATVDVHAAQEAASSGVAPAAGAPAGGSGRSDSTPTSTPTGAGVDPRLAYRMSSSEAGRSGSREA